eukprot:4150328-Amphidinium_carterae.1
MDVAPRSLGEHVEAEQEDSDDLMVESDVAIRSSVPTVSDVTTPLVEGRNIVSSSQPSGGEVEVKASVVNVAGSSPSKALKVSQPSEEYKDVVSRLSAFGVPQTRSRTNIGTCRSQLFGLFTKRGVGITNATRERVQVTQLLHDLAKTRSDPTPYLAIAFNEMSDAGVQEH